MSNPASLRLICAGLLVASFGLAGETSVVPIDFPTADITVALGINPAGDIVGTYLLGGVRHGYRLRQDTFAPIDYPGGLQTSADGINAAGDIAGGYLDSAGRVHAFLRSHEGVFNAIDFPGALHTLATAINDAGKIVGAYTNSAIPNHAFRGFTLDKGHFTPIDFPGADLTVVTGINAASEIVGAYRGTDGRIHGFLLRGGDYTTVQVPGSIDTFALGINPRGDIVGQFKMADGWHGFAMSMGTTQTIDFPGGTEGPGPSFWPFKENAAYGISASGNIVGQYRGSDGRLHGYLLSLGCEDQELLTFCMAKTDDAMSQAEFRRVAAALREDGLWKANIDVLGCYFATALGRPAPWPDLYGIPDAGQPGRNREYTLEQWWSMLRARHLVGLHMPSRPSQ